MRYRTSDAMAEFDRWSKSYDRSVLQRLFFRPSHDLILQHLSHDDRRVLDIGCGTGLFAERLLQQFPGTRVWGLDLSSEMLHRGLARYRQLDRCFIVRGDSERLPFCDRAFDVITCSHSFHHYPNQLRVVEEMFRVLRPDGRLFIIDGDRDSPWGWLIFDLIVTWAEGPVHHCSARRFRELFSQVGFQRVRQYRRGGPLPFLLTIGQAYKPVVVRPASEAA